MSTEHRRYAIYLAPRAGSAWGVFGARCIGRCAAGGAACEPLAIAGVEPGVLAALTSDPRRYGFHATLKPPFRLAPGRTLHSLIDALRQRFAAEPAFELPALQPCLLGSFIALAPAGPSPRADRLAEDCVRLFDDWRAPLTEAELARRLAHRLDARGRELLERWGYPSVLERFRLHFSLTGQLAAEHRSLEAVLCATARQRLPATPMVVDSVCLFEEHAPGADLQLLERFDFTAVPGAGSH